MRKPTSALVFLLLFSSTSLFAHHDEREEHPGHSSQGPAFNEGPRQRAVLYESTGNVVFPVSSTSEEARRYFLQGVGQLHGFFSFEAERSFRTAAAIDPNCAMCFWGMAMANTVDGAGSPARAKGFIALAKQKSGALTANERMWIESLFNLYQAGVPVKKEAREIYAADLQHIVDTFKDDLEAKAFLTLTLWENYVFYQVKLDTLRLDKLIDEVLAVNPMHPVHHYKIHLWDSSKQPEKAVKSAALCGPAARSIAHMWHMPGHIYWSLKRYFDSAWQQEASLRVDHRDMETAGNLPYYIGNYLHNSMWLMSSLHRTGSALKAIEIGKNLIEIPRHPKDNPFGLFGGDGMRGIITLLDQNEMWAEALQLEKTSYFLTEADPILELYKQRLLYLAKYFLKLPKSEVKVNMQLVKSLLPPARKAVEANTQMSPKAKLHEMKKFDAVEEETGIYENILEKVSASNLAAVKVWEKKVQDAMPENSDEYWEQAPVFHLEDLFAELKSYPDALRVADGLVKSSPEQVQPVAKKIELLFLAGDKDAAKTLFEKALQPNSEQIDLDLPLYSRLTSILQSMGYKKDWRIPRVQPTDLGERPKLSTLGPLFWKRPSAPKGLHAGFDSYLNQKKPMLVIFYLGACPACSAQLHALTEEGWEKKFAGVGIQLVGIGSKKAGSDIVSFPLLADENLNLFRALGAHDDFEKKPLHGIFLIDQNGAIAWKTVTADTFLDFGFLLQESRRLLTLN